MTNESVNIVDSERWFKIGSCCEASEGAFLVVSTLLKGHTVRNLCGFPSVDDDQQKDSKTKKKRKKKALPRADVKNGRFQSVFKHEIFL